MLLGGIAVPVIVHVIVTIWVCGQDSNLHLRSDRMSCHYSFKRPHVYHIWFPIGVRTADMADRGRIELPSWESKSHVLTVELSVYNGGT